MQSISLVIFTICTISHLSQGLNSICSALKNLSDSAVSGVVFVVDSDGGPSEITINGYSVSLIYLSEAVGANELEKLLAMGYSALELCCFLKPVAAKYILAKSECETLTYLDSDCFVLGDFSTIYPEEWNFLVTPHYLNVSECRGDLVDLLATVRSGQLNAGFFAVRNSVVGREILDTWDCLNKRACMVATSLGVNADQGWLSLAMSLHAGEIFVIRHPGFNLGWWRFSPDRLRFSNDKYIYEDQPLLMFHFTGADSSDLRLTSKHSNSKQYLTLEGQMLFQRYYSAINEVECELPIQLYPKFTFKRSRFKSLVDSLEHRFLSFRRMFVRSYE